MKQSIKITAAACLCAGMAAAQTSPARSQGQQKRQPPTGASAAGQPNTQELMRQNGGSLLRAQLANNPPEQRNSLESVSFFHVPPPEPRTIAKHDLVTIIIREESRSKSDAQAEMTRESQIDARLTEWVKLNLGNLAIEGGAIGAEPPSVAAEAQRSFSGDGQLDRRDTFIARIQAEVIDIKPNGTLVLQARKRIKTDEEEQFFVLSGVCRAEDVTADNSVLSTQLFDLDLAKSTRGPVNDAVKRGAAHRFLDWLNPF